MNFGLHNTVNSMDFMVDRYTCPISSSCLYSCCPLYTKFGLAAVLEVSWDLFTHQIPHSFGFEVYGTNTMLLTVL